MKPGTIEVSGIDLSCQLGYHMKTQFVTNDKGKKVAAVVPIREYNKMLKDLEELEDITLYDQAKKNDPEGLPIDEAFSIIEAERKK